MEHIFNFDCENRQNNGNDDEKYLYEIDKQFQTSILPYFVVLTTSILSILRIAFEIFATIQLIEVLCKVLSDAKSNTTRRKESYVK